MGYKTEKKIPSIILSVFIVLLILVGTIVPAYAAPTQDMMVTDSGEMLSDREEQEVSEMLYSINRQTGIEYLVYTIKSLNGEDIETCANRLFRTAGLGDKEKDNGLLLLISYDDRKFRLEVGYGLEGDIPDTQAANIINTMTPYFKEGNYGDGVKAAVKQTAVILNSSGEYTIVMLGDCRNNKNYSGVEEVEWLSKRASNFFVLNPDPLNKWGQGDSIADLYAKSGATVCRVSSTQDLLTFLEFASLRKQA